jgi:predicted transcriptional regulator
MDDTPRAMDAPQDWIDALDESMADIAAGRVVSGDVVRRELLESIARMEAKPASARKRGAARPR